VRHDVFPLPVAEVRKLVAGPHMRSTREVGEGPPEVVGFLAVQKYTAGMAVPALAVEKGIGPGKIGGAEAAEGGRIGEHIGDSTGVPKIDLLDEVAPMQDLEIGLADGPLGDEGADPAVTARHARPLAKLVVHEHGKGAVVVVVGTEPVGDPHHAIGAAVGFVVHGLAHGDERACPPAGGDGREVGRIRGHRGTHGDAKHEDGPGPLAHTRAPRVSPAQGRSRACATAHRQPA
jgi:hypothetical protein